MVYDLWNTWTWYVLIAVFLKDWRNSSRTHDFRYRFIRTIFFQSPAWSWTRFYPGSTRSGTLRRNREIARNWIHSGMYLGFSQGTHQNVMSTYILYFTKSGAFTVEKSAWEKGPPPPYKRSCINGRTMKYQVCCPSIYLISFFRAEVFLFLF